MTFPVDGDSTTIAISEIPQTHGVVRVEMQGPKADGEPVEAAVADVVAAAVAGAAA